MGILGSNPRRRVRKDPDSGRFRGPGEPPEKRRENRLKVDRARRAMENLKLIFGDGT